MWGPLVKVMERTMALVRRGPLAATACVAALVVACHGGILFGGQQYAFRDSGHFYYPLYWRVQQEWSAGRLPTWEPGANGGMPLLGHPMAAVVYPGKLIFALVSYPWGVRLYTVGHEVLAFWAMLALMRSWGVSRTGATLAAMSYAFGGPVLSDYFNIIYLVGAAWLPLGFLAVDRWVRLGRRRGLVELALVLSMQVLGGDPETAYLTVVCGLGYALFLAVPATDGRRRPWRWALGLLAVAGIWAWIGPWLARRLHGDAGRWTQVSLLGLWAVAIAIYAATRRAEPRRRVTATVVGLAAAGLLGLLLAGIQVVPVLGQITRSVRWSGDGLADLFDSSLIPYRVLEFLWPNVFGTFTPGDRYWVTILPPQWAHRPSPLSLYVGALPLVLALAAAGFRGKPPWAAWMTAIAILSLWASLGAFAGPGAWSSVGDPTTAGDDGFYGLLTSVLPALRLFRFPFKLLAFTSLSLSALAGLGWDRCGNGLGRRRAVALAGGLLVLGILGLVLAVGLRGMIHSAIAARVADHLVFGPVDTAGATDAIVTATVHGACALALSLVIVCWPAGRRRSVAAILALVVVAADLGLANARLVISAPQADFDREPEALRAIREAERIEPSPGPIRIHRIPSWVPVGWGETRSTHRLRDLIDWEIDTLQPSFGWLHGLDYVFVDESETGRADQRRLFRPEYRSIDPALAGSLGLEPGRVILWHARGAFDLWVRALFHPAGRSRRLDPQRPKLRRLHRGHGPDLSGPDRPRACAGAKGVATEPGRPGPQEPEGIPSGLDHPRCPADPAPRIVHQSTSRCPDRPPARCRPTRVIGGAGSRSRPQTHGLHRDRRPDEPRRLSPPGRAGSGSWSLEGGRGGLRRDTETRRPRGLPRSAGDRGAGRRLRLRLVRGDRRLEGTGPAGQPADARRRRRRRTPYDCLLV